MNKWYQQLLNEIGTMGNRIFITDSHSLLCDMNFISDLSSEYVIHEYENDSDFYLFLNHHLNDKIIFYSNINISRDYIQSNFIQFELVLNSIFPDLEVELLDDVDVSFYQKIFNYYQELKSHCQSIETQQLILKSVWDLDFGELYSPTNNLKIALSFLIDDKELPASIIDLISKKLDTNVLKLKTDHNQFTSWLNELLNDYVLSITDDKHPKYDLSDNIIQFYLSNGEYPFKIEINDYVIEKQPWLVKFSRDDSPEIQKSRVIADVSTLKTLLAELEEEEEFDLNKLELLFDVSRNFCYLLYRIQINDFKMDKFFNLESCYSNLNNLFKKLLAEGKFESLFRYPYDQRPYTVDRILSYILHNFKEENIALIVFDGMSYDEWFILKDSLNDFDFEETESFAILPTITSFSRTSIFAGKVPREFMKNNKINPNTEKNELISFLTSREYSENDILYGRIDLNDKIIKTGSEQIEYNYLKDYRFMGLICSLFDDISHATNIYGDVKSNLYKNIKNSIDSSQIVFLLNKMRELGYRIIITSDHGNIFSKSNGIKSNKNLEFERRKSNRCLIFDNELFADTLISNNPNKCFKYSYNIIPNNLTLVFPESNEFFSTKNNYSITHGSIMPEEWIVPVVVLK